MSQTVMEGEDVLKEVIDWEAGPPCTARSHRSSLWPQ